MILNDTSLILLSAGSSSRFGLPVKKQWLYQDDKPLWLSVADEFNRLYSFKKVIITASSDDIEYMRLFSDYTIVEGGSSRQESLKRALEYIDTPFVLVNDIARCCIDRDMIDRVLSQKSQADCIVPAIKAIDTMYEGDRLLNRDKLRSIQTPQLSSREVLKRAISKDIEFTDESGAISAIGGSIKFVEGSQKARKLTTKDDLSLLPCLKAPKHQYFCGFGIDTHPFQEDKEMYLCGIKIDSDVGFKAHSDGDVAIHSLIDAMLGGCSMGDIGELFPDTDDRYKNIDSKELLKDVITIIRARGMDIESCDMTIVAQKPKIMRYKGSMREKLSDILEIPKYRINIKATTSEKLGFIGREEGVTVHSVATMKYFDWSIV